jgi:hypothetical protein
MEGDHTSAKDPGLFEQIKQQMSSIMAEWYLLVLIFLGSLVPSLNLEAYFPGRLPYIIRSTFQVCKLCYVLVQSCALQHVYGAWLAK